MENNIIINHGERLTFFQIFNEKKWNIEVPIIQRDYAQGRLLLAEIRETFLNTLYDSLLNDKNIDLDFIYGNLSQHNNNLFIPLDGQQRLTTLFLLHWLLANKDNQVEIFREHFVEVKASIDDKESIKVSRFTYETRKSSAEFCNALVNCNIDFTKLIHADKDKFNSLSKTIKDSEWYFSSWGKDPTVQSMLIMLDAIHIKFKNSSGYFNKLLDTKKPIITFQFLNLKDFNLTDDLYIKMNARGKQLTPFENFKAKFEQYIKNLDFKNKAAYKLKYNDEEIEVTFSNYFSNKIDTDWADLFWNYKDKKTNTFDDELMNFIRVIATNHYASKEKEEDKLENLKILFGKENPENKDQRSQPITFSQYKEIECFDESFILNLIKIFDSIKNGDDGIKHYLKDKFYYNEESIFNKVIKNEITTNERVQFYAFVQYLMNNNSYEGLWDWMRVIHNLSENTDYNKLADYSRAIQGINSLLKHSSDILTYISDIKNTFTGFLDIQIKEERIKAILFQKSIEWKKAILKIEKHGYFKGQIGFIINFSGIEEYFDINKNCIWSEVDDKKYLINFDNYSDKAKSIFDTNGLIDFKDSVFERSLLTKGDYLLYKNTNWSFLINNDRNIGWKRLLRDDNKGKREFVKQLFDDNNFTLSDVHKSLINIVKKSNVTDWRKYFISNSGIFNYLGKNKFIRWYSEDSIYLLKKERMRAAHAEYYTYAFYLENMVGKEADFLPFKEIWYHDPGGDSDEPCAVLDDLFYKGSNYAIDLRYFSKKQEFEIRFFDRNELVFQTEITKILETKHFKMTNKYSDVSYLLNGKDPFKIAISLKDLCQSFKKFN